MTGHAQMKGFRSLQKQPGIERAHGRAHVAQAQHAGPQDKSHLPEGIHKAQAVIGRLGIVEGRKASGGVPVELTGIHDQPANGGAVSADELGGGMDDDGGPVLDGTAQEGRGYGIVHHQRDAVPPADIGDLGDVDDIELGIADGFDEKGPGAIRDRLFPGRDIVRGHVADLNSQFAEGMGKKAYRSPIEIGRCHDFIAGSRQGQDGQGFGGLPGGYRQRANTSLQGGNSLLQSVGGGIHDTGVDIAELAQPEEIRGVLRVFEDIG